MGEKDTTSPDEITAGHEFTARQSRARLLPRVLLVGLLAGGVAVAFRFALHQAEELREALLVSGGRGWLQFLLHWLAATAATAVAIFLVRKVSPAAGGSGIPHLKAVLLHMRRFLPLPVLFVKFVGGILAMGCGLALGREGPTIQMGGATGKLAGRMMGMTQDERFILIAAGAGAGLSAAFNAPLAGLVFALEEIQRAFHRRIFFATLLASVVADTVSRMALGQQPVFSIPSYPIPSLGLLPVFLLLGVFSGVAGAAFNSALVRSLDIGPRIIPNRNILILAAVAGLTVAAAGTISPELTGSGHSLTQGALTGKHALGGLALILAVRMVLTVVSYSTGAPGGIFAPLLVLGSCGGLAIGLLGQRYYPIAIPDASIFAVVGMAALFSATVRAPLTGIVLVIEMTGEHTQMLPLLVACLTGFLVADHLGSHPIYHTLMERELDDYRHRMEEEAHAERAEISDVPGVK
ncbi:MAG: H(+)/Cl(-) exchange transporter ClcA [Verrucomicrobiales bacterium]